MSEIEELYENAGVRYFDINACKIDETGKNGKHNIYRYPPFTAEKQLDLIKVLATNKIDKDYQYIAIDKDEIEDEWYFNFFIQPNKYHAHDKDFAIGLAKLVNILWQDLTEQEKAEIKEILK